MYELIVHNEHGLHTMICELGVYTVRLGYREGWPQPYVYACI
jgi:hypothetical protein